MGDRQESETQDDDAVSNQPRRIPESEWRLPSPQQREQEFIHMLEDNPNPVLIADCETLRFVAANTAASLQYGFSREQFLSMDLRDISSQEDVPDLACLDLAGASVPILCVLCNHVRQHRKKESEFVEVGLRRHVREDGSLMLVKVYAQSIRFMDRPVWLITVKDVTARERGQETMKLLVDVVAAAVEATDVYQITSRCLEKICSLTRWPVGQAWFLDERKNALVCSSSYYSDFDVHELRSESLRKNLSCGNDLPGRAWQANSAVWIEDFNNDGRSSRSALAVLAGLKAGFAFPIHDSEKLVAVFEFFSQEGRLPDRHLLEALEKLGLHLATVFQRKREEEEIRHQAYHDVLTGLPNRILFKDRIMQSLAHAHRDRQELALLFLDLDRFKMINDTHGHHVGDELLKEVSLRLSAGLREMDTVARLGGDEFMILLPRVEQMEDAAKVAQKLLDSFKPVFHIHGHDFHVTTSIGVSLFPHDGDDVQTLMKNADVALYRAKEKGRNNYQLYTPSMTSSAVARLNLENNLRRAIQQEEFSIHFQPLIDLKSGKVIAAEALLRWEHPELGVFMPEEFIPVAEETGLITPIWEWALIHACRQLKLWEMGGIGPETLSMNISSYQFQHPNLVPVVLRTLKETGLDPRALTLEITEGMAMKGDFAASLLRDFKQMGVRISIDDFGTGYSSLGQLKRFPIDYLKIDPFFVRELPCDSNDLAIVNSIITLAHGLHMKVIAEGVETVQQLNVLRSLNCDAIQGFLICRPMPANQLTFLFQKGIRMPDV